MQGTAVTSPSSVRGDRLLIFVLLGIEEVNLFKDDGTVIHFNNPRFHIGSGANMYVVSGRAENKTIQEILPSLLKNSALGAAAAAAAESKKGEEDVPELVESFEA
jgi:nascent polypeptide-associated complex subunit beta